MKTVQVQLIICVTLVFVISITQSFFQVNSFLTFFWNMKKKQMKRKHGLIVENK